MLQRLFPLTLIFIGLVWTQPAAGQGFIDELLAPWNDEHASQLGTPYVHAFGVEPAFNDRDIILEYGFGQGFDDGAVNEQEFEAELEWALTDRLGIIIEAGVAGIDEKEVSFDSGFKDMAIGGRVVVIKQDRFILSSITEVEIPTGDDTRDLGRGEAAIAPTVAWWVDLGSWWTFQGQFGPEIGLESGETELLYRVALAKTWQGPVLFDGACRCSRRRCCDCENSDFHNISFDDDDHEDHHGHDDDDHSHHAPGLITAYVELTGFTPLESEDESTAFDLLGGFGYGLTESLETRFGVRVPVTSPEGYDAEYIFSFIRHF